MMSPKTASPAFAGLDISPEAKDYIEAEELEDSVRSAFAVISDLFPAPVHASLLLVVDPGDVEDIPSLVFDVTSSLPTDEFYKQKWACYERMRTSIGPAISQRIGILQT